MAKLSLFFVSFASLCCELFSHHLFCRLEENHGLIKSPVAVFLRFEIVNGGIMIRLYINEEAWLIERYSIEV